jgi:hypothetical protein
MMDFAADNHRLRHEMRRVIAEREIASKALGEIGYGSCGDPSARAKAALDEMKAVSSPTPTEARA